MGFAEVKAVVPIRRLRITIVIFIEVY